MILVGELRDLETIAIAIETAETGSPRLRHAAHEHGRVHGRPRHRSVPGGSPGADPGHAVGIAPRRHRADPVPQGRGRTDCRRWKCCRDQWRISNLIREGKTFQIPSMMQVGTGPGHDLVERRAERPGQEGAHHRRRSAVSRGRQELDEHAAQEVNGFHARRQATSAAIGPRIASSRRTACTFRLQKSGRQYRREMAWNTCHDAS